MLIGITKFAATLLINGYIFGPMCTDACNTVFKNRNVDERAEIITRGTMGVGGIITSAVIADGLVDMIMKKGTEEAVKGFIRAIV
jgi:hypothetical protein